VKHLARRGLEQGYQEFEDSLPSVRGRVDLIGSARRLQLVHGRATCVFDELTANTTANRIVKSTLRYLCGIPTLDPSLREDLLRLRRGLQGVDDVPLVPAVFRTVQLHANNRFYRFLLNVCEFIRGAWLVDEIDGSHKFRDFLRDERRMARVFQDFVFNFYRLERPELRPRVERIFWRAESDSDPTLALLPIMETDITLRLPNENLIIDTKYYTETLATRVDAAKLHSQNLYQLFAYLMNAHHESNRATAGMLLYPVVDRQLRESYRVHGHQIRVCTVDLAQPWQAIRNELLGLLQVA
jgi:5-methylcytosine-specific restriction enzyme subunit McrC